jgi:hypothetical protein
VDPRGGVRRRRRARDGERLVADDADDADRPLTTMTATMIGERVGDDGPTGSASQAMTSEPTSGPTSPTSGRAGPSGPLDTGVDETTGTKFDVSGGETATTEPSETTGPPIDVCKVQDDMDAMVPCTDEAPPNSFEPDIQWAWPGQDGDTQVAVTPVVANLTDDNGDGEIDLCDIPDIVVPRTRAVVLVRAPVRARRGDRRGPLVKVPNVNAITYPAIGDIDGDGLPEIVTGRTLSDGRSPATCWRSSTTAARSGPAPTQYNDRLGGDRPRRHRRTTATSRSSTTATVFDHNGALLWAAPNSGARTSTRIADLDGDGNMEVILGPRAFRHDGSLYYSAPIGDGHPQVADLDADGLPEVLVVTLSGLSLLEHDGAVKWPTRSRTSPTGTARRRSTTSTATCMPELAVARANTYACRDQLMAKWTAPVRTVGFASSTAFDFLGDGTAEAMYADESALFIFGDMGQVLLTSPRGSWTQWENPIVADVDNDGSAEIVVVSNKGYANFMESPPLQVVRDKRTAGSPRGGSGTSTRTT